MNRFSRFRRMAFVLIALAILGLTLPVSAAFGDTVAFGDFNNDGLLDVAAITAPTTITVGLANLGGSYTVSAILTAPKNWPMQNVYVYDRDGDGNLDVIAISSQPGKDLYAVHTWLGNGDGTFDSRMTDIAKWPPPPGRGGGW